MLFWDKLIRFLYLVGLIEIAMSLPIFNVGMSIGSFWIVGVWLVDYLYDIIIYKDPSSKWRQFIKNKYALLLCSLFLLHGLGLLITEDFSYAIRDLRIKLPLLFMPIVFSSLPKLTGKELRIVFNIFIAALVFSCFTCLMVYWGWVDKELQDIRGITKVFITRISHIRLSLLICMGIILLAFRLNKSWFSVGYSVLILLFLYFLWVVESVTGSMVLGVVIGLFLIRTIIRSNRRVLQWQSGIGLLVLCAFMIGFFTQSYSDYFSAPDIDSIELEEFTEGGEKYDHGNANLIQTNGHYVWLYVAWAELNHHWSGRSEIGFYDYDRRGEQLYGTLIRYMTSKGLRKDAQGVAALTDQDVLHIENGFTNAVHLDRRGLRQRIDQIFFEMDLYFNGGNPSGSSVTQRFEFWKTARYIIGDHLLFGVGTGDVQLAFDQQYESMDSQLENQFRLRAHNQYLTMFVTFGLLGFVWFLLVLSYPFRNKTLRSDPIFLTFFIIGLMSFLTEDTLETQAGVTFFAFFYCLLGFGLRKEARHYSTAPSSGG